MSKDTDTRIAVDSNYNLLIDISRLLIVFAGINVLISSVMFFVHITISRWHLPCSFALAVITFVYVWKSHIKDLFKAVSSSLVVLTLLLILNAWFYELAYDGNLYHKFATGILAYGYNPVYDRVDKYLTMMKVPMEAWYADNVWIECYPKASWIFDSCFYVWTNWIESSKVFNLVIMLSCIGIAYDYFRFKLKKRDALLISLIFAVTPTSIAMIFSYYLDGALGQLLFISIIVLLSISDGEYNEYKKSQYIILFFSIVLCGNLKISGLAFEAVFCGVFFLWWILAKKELGFTNKMILNNLGFYIITVIITVLVVGYDTYITNIIHYKSVAYPMGAMDGFDIANNLKPVGLEKSLPLIQIVSMIFVKTNTLDTIPYLEWKMPFSFDASQLKHSTYDVIRGGAGVFYSGILIIAIAVFLDLAIKNYRRKSFDKNAIYIVIFTIWINTTSF